MRIPKEALFYDVCCGSGAVTLALLESGHPPERIVMVDQGPWGLFWKAIGEGSFDLDVFRRYCADIPADPRAIKQHIEELHGRTVGADCIYVFLLLQATAIGGKAVWFEGDRWKRGAGFRDYWVPTATSSRRSHVNPMMPMPDTILERVTAIVTRARGLTGSCQDARTLTIPDTAVAYIDPPYLGTTGYPYELEVVEFARALGCPCWISEGYPIPDRAGILHSATRQLSTGRSKGGITGDRKKAANEEWLSYLANGV